MEVAEKIHAELGPSGAPAWMRCPGKVILERGKQDRPSIHAAWGTAAHEVADLCLQPYAKGERPLDADSFVGRVFQIDGYDVAVDMEMADCVNTYVSYIETYVDVAAGDTFYPEQRLDISFLTGEEGAGGTSDGIGIAGRRLIVIDLKGGRGVQVDADSEQLRVYGLAALREYELLYEFDDVMMVIIQPRLNHVSEHVMTVAELEAWRDNELLPAVQMVGFADVNSNMGELADLWVESYLRPGEKQCRFCKARSTCPAIRSAVEDAIAHTAPAADTSDFADLSLPKQVAAVASADNMTQLADDHLSEAMRAAPLVEIWLKEVRAETERRLLDGRPVAGFKLVEGHAGNRAWGDEAAAEEALKKARLKSDEMYDKKVISPTKAEKLLKDKPRAWAKIAPLIGERAEGKPSVAPESDKRPAWTPAAAADEFEALPAAPEEDPLFA